MYTWFLVTRLLFRNGRASRGRGRVRVKVRVANGDGDGDGDRGRVRGNTGIASYW